MAKKMSDIKVALNFLLKYYCSMVLMGTEYSYLDYRTKK